MCPDTPGVLRLRIQRVHGPGRRLFDATALARRVWRAATRGSRWRGTDLVRRRGRPGNGYPLGRANRRRAVRLVVRWARDRRWWHLPTVPRAVALLRPRCRPLVDRLRLARRPGVLVPILPSARRPLPFPSSRMVRRAVVTLHDMFPSPRRHAQPLTAHTPRSTIGVPILVYPVRTSMSMVEVRRRLPFAPPLSLAVFVMAETHAGCSDWMEGCS